MFVEVDQTGDVLHEFRGQLVFTKHSGSHCRCDCRLEMRCGVSLPDLPRRVLMESVHQIIEYERVDIATFQRSNWTRSSPRAVRSSRS